MSAISTQNLILPSGTSKIGQYEYDVETNGSPLTTAELNDLPVKTSGNTVIYIHDVAQVRDGFPPQTNIVRVEWPARGADDGAEDGQCLDARYHFPD